MAQFFTRFPRIAYDIAGKQLTNYQVATNLFFRLAVVREALNNISAYYNHIISDHETPEILAEQVYGNPEAHWVILLTNEIVDPQYDWPLNYREFQNFIIDKYGSIATAKTTYHHYEKVITREESATGLVTTTRFIVNEDKLTDNALSVPYDYYAGLAETQTVNTYNMSDGKTVVEIVNRNAVNNYDYENELNESKRQIKIIKPQYYPQIKLEFDALTKQADPLYIRRLA